MIFTCIQHGIGTKQWTSKDFIPIKETSDEDATKLAIFILFFFLYKIALETDVHTAVMKKEIARIFATRICLFVPWGIPIIITRFFFLVIIELYLGKTESLISAFYTIVTKEFFCNFFTSCLDAVYIV